jgi:hypothetical protein
MGSMRRMAFACALVAVVACASPPPSTTPQRVTSDPCSGRPTANVRARLAEGKLASALRVSEWACVDDRTRKELAEARAWLAEPSNPDAVIAEAKAARARGDPVLSRRLFDRAALGMQRAGSSPRWELPGSIGLVSQAVFLGSTQVASVAGTRVALTEVATGARQLLSPRAASDIRDLTAAGDGRFLVAAAGDEVLVWDGAGFAGRIRVKNAGVRFTPDGRTLVLQNEDGVTFWDPITRQTIAVVAGPTLHSDDLIFVGNRLVIAFDDGTVVVVEPATGAVLAKLPPIRWASYWRVAASPDGRVLLRSRSWEETRDSKRPDRSGVELFDTSAWRRLGTFETGHQGFTARPAMSRDGARVFGPIGTWLAVFDVQRRKLEATWPVGTEAPHWHPVSVLALGGPIDGDSIIRRIELTQDERRIVACDLLSCDVVDWRTGRHATVGRYARFLPDGSVISGDGEQPGRFDVLDANFESRRLDLGQDHVEFVPATSAEWGRLQKLLVPLEPCGSPGEPRVSADGTIVLKADKPGRPCVWKRDDGHLLPRPPELPDFAPVASLVFSGTRLLVMGAARWARVLDLQTGVLSQAREAEVSRLRSYGSVHVPIATDAWPKDTVSHDADLLAMDDGVLVREPARGAFVVDTATGAKRWTLDAEKRARGSPVAFAQGCIALATRRYVDVWDTASHERRQHLDCGTVVDGIAIDVSAAQIAARCGGRIFVWELATGGLLRQVDLPNSGPAGAFAFRDNWTVANVGTDLVAWEGRAHPEPKWRWPSSSGRATSVATDGHIVAAARGPGDVSVYSLDDGRERVTVRFWNSSTPEAILEAPDGAVWDADGGLLSQSQCMRGDQEVPTELCESLWVQDDLWRRQMK